jgi:DNA-binding XRE family transcriptional regulator
MTRRTKPPHQPTPDTRQLVQLHTTVGTNQEDVARILGISPKTLRLHYRDELDLSLAKANATIGGALFNKAKGGDTAAMIFWMKTQAGWKEKSVVEGPGPNGEHILRIERRIVRPNSGD